MGESGRFENLLVWQKSMDLVVEIYRVTESFPRTEVYGLISQMRWSAVSIPSNIAEGSKRGSRKDYQHFLLISYGSGAELETQLEIARRIGFIGQIEFAEIRTLLNEVLRMLQSMISKF